MPGFLCKSETPAANTNFRNRVSVTLIYSLCVRWWGNRNNIAFRLTSLSRRVVHCLTWFAYCWRLFFWGWASHDVSRPRLLVLLMIRMKIFHLWRWMVFRTHLHTVFVMHFIYFEISLYVWFHVVSIISYKSKFCFTLLFFVYVRQHKQEVCAYKMTKLAAYFPHTSYIPTQTPLPDNLTVHLYNCRFSHCECFIFELLLPGLQCAPNIFNMYHIWNKYIYDFVRRVCKMHLQLLTTLSFSVHDSLWTYTNHHRHSNTHLVFGYLWTFLLEGCSLVLFDNGRTFRGCIMWLSVHFSTTLC